MSRCKDCLHKVACLMMIKSAFPQLKEDEIETVIKRENNCICFKPTAGVVEVVRCKDCKHCYHRTINPERYECEYYGCSDEIVDYVQPTHYCSYGERRER